MRTILLVDGDQPLTRTVAFMLRMMSFIVVTAGSGQEAHQMLRIARPDVILCGDTLPDMAGEQLWAALQQHGLWRCIPMIILTARPQPPCGGPDRPRYLIKPFRRLELLEMILAALQPAPEAAA
ncbi:MAG TPA: response regulator [Herpetosiphonaceae bacterium]|nr:response regulator [Herpetosiphonaceae bacterium]